MLASEEPSIATVLIACVLFICMEMYRNSHEAHRHMTSGLSLFFDWYSKRDLHSRGATLRPTGSSDKLAQQLYKIFGRLMLQTVLFSKTSDA